MEKHLKELLKEIYGNDLNLEKEADQIFKICQKYESVKYQKFTNKDLFLISYADSFWKKGEAPLKTLTSFASQELKFISNIHILPCFPYSSDDGFSVIDYFKINDDYGSWNDIEHLAMKKSLMLDAVVNHCSKENLIFKKFLNNELNYQKFFLEYDKNFDYSKVIRPRTSNLFHTYDGKKVWTTFSEDQVDLNFDNIEVFKYVLDILLFYASKGARSIRLDAVGFIGKESGTTCMHTKKTHLIIKLYKYLISQKFENINFITETNVPHQENISYFGENDEADLVYQFVLPPLILHSFLAHDSKKFIQWLDSLQELNGVTQTTFFNFLSSHDGIGMRSIETLLSQTEKENLEKTVLQNGGQISYRTTKDGEIPYELNITYFDALCGNEQNEALKVKKYVTAHALLSFLKGVPAIYYNSLFGFKSWQKGFEESLSKRRLNREKHQLEKIYLLLNGKNINQKIFTEIEKICEIRICDPLLDPYNSVQIPVFINKNLISFIRKKDNIKKLFVFNLNAKDVKFKYEKIQSEVKAYEFQIINL